MTTLQVTRIESDAGDDDFLWFAVGHVDPARFLATVKAEAIAEASAWGLSTAELDAIEASTLDDVGHVHLVRDDLTLTIAFGEADENGAFAATVLLTDPRDDRSPASRDSDLMSLKPRGNA